MRIAVLGGGHGAYAAAADLTELGHEVRLWRRDPGAFEVVLQSQSIRLKDAQGTRLVRIALATSDLAAALHGANLILLPVPAMAQEDIARAISPHLERGQVVFAPPGTFGSYAMARTVRNLGGEAEVMFAETGTLPYLARKHAVDEVAITIRAKHLPVGVFPAQRTADALDIIAKAYPVVHPVEDALSAALMNAGPIIHPPLILMNAGPLQHFERWDIHNEGTQPAVRRVTDALDAERIALRESFGYAPYHYPFAITTQPTGGCMAMLTTALPSQVTGASTSLCSRTATCVRMSHSGWHSWFRCLAGARSRHRSRAVYSRSRQLRSARTSTSILHARSRRSGSRQSPRTRCAACFATGLRRERSPGHRCAGGRANGSWYRPRLCIRRA